jgi:hypothetical protein
MTWWLLLLLLPVAAVLGYGWAAVDVLSSRAGWLVVAAVAVAAIALRARYT